HTRPRLPNISRHQSSGNWSKLLFQTREFLARLFSESKRVRQSRRRHCYAPFPTDIISHCIHDTIEAPWFSLEMNTCPLLGIAAPRGQTSGLHVVAPSDEGRAVFGLPISAKI